MEISILKSYVFYLVITYIDKWVIGPEYAPPGPEAKWAMPWSLAASPAFVVILNQARRGGRLKVMFGLLLVRDDL